MRFSERVVPGKFIDSLYIYLKIYIYTYIEYIYKEKGSKIYDLGFCFRKIEKDRQIKFRISRKILNG